MPFSQYSTSTLTTLHMYMYIVLYYSIFQHFSKRKGAFVKLFMEKVLIGKRTLRMKPFRYQKNTHVERNYPERNQYS